MPAKRALTGYRHDRLTRVVLLQAPAGGGGFPVDLGLLASDARCSALQRGLGAAELRLTSVQSELGALDVFPGPVVDRRCLVMCRTCALIQGLLTTFEALFPLVDRPLSHIGEAFAPVGKLFALIGLPVPLVGVPVALIGLPVPLIGGRAAPLGAVGRRTTRSVGRCLLVHRSNVPRSRTHDHRRV